MKQKYYAVRVGLTPGIYDNWEDCKKMVDGFPGAVYKSFSTCEDAKRFLGSDGDAGREDDYAFVDGSFNAEKSVYGYGGFVVCQGKKHIISGSGTDEEMAAMRNVAGEIMGCMAAVSLALQLGMKKLTVYYDYMGIEKWAIGEWKRNKKGTMAYYDYMQEVKDKIKIRFVKVKGHSGIEGNEEADRLAKKAVGLSV